MSNTAKYLILAIAAICRITNCQVSSDPKDLTRRQALYGTFITALRSKGYIFRTFGDEVQVSSGPPNPQTWYGQFVAKSFEIITMNTSKEFPVGTSFQWHPDDGQDGQYIAEYPSGYSGDKYYRQADRC